MKKQRDFAGNILGLLAMTLIALALALLLGTGCAVQQVGTATTSEASPTPLMVALEASPTPIPPTATPTQEMTFYSPIDTPTVEPTPTEEKPTPTATLPILTGFSAERIQVAKISPIPVMVEGEEKEAQVVGWSPDGRKVVLDVNTGVMYGAINPLTGHKISLFAYDLWLANLDGSSLEKIVPNGDMLKWSPDGSMMAFLTSRSIDGIYRHELGYISSESGENEKKILLAFLGVQLDWLDNDTIAFLEDDRIQLIDVDGKAVRPFTIDGIGDRKIRRFFFSPDRKKIAFGTAVPGEVRLWIADIKGERAYPIAHFDMFDSPVFLAWSPDSARLAYKSYDFWPLTIVNVDGTNPIEVGVWAPGTNITWSPDGEVIALSGFEPRADGIREYPATPPGILVVNADGTGLRRITPPEEEAWFPFWSPDGLRIAYSRGETRATTLSLELR